MWIDHTWLPLFKGRKLQSMDHAGLAMCRTLSVMNNHEVFSKVKFSWRNGISEPHSRSSENIDYTKNIGYHSYIMVIVNGWIILQGLWYNPRNCVIPRRRRHQYLIKVCIWDIRYSAVPLKRGQFPHKYSQQTPHSSPVRATYGFFVDPASDWYSASISEIIHVISYNTRPCYNGTRTKDLLSICTCALSVILFPSYPA